MDRIDFSQSNRWLVLVSTMAIAIPVPAWAASGNDGALTTLSALARDALYTLFWALNALGITSRAFVILVCVVAALVLASWLARKVFTLGKRAAGG